MVGVVLLAGAGAAGGVLVLVVAAGGAAVGVTDLVVDGVLHVGAEALGLVLPLGAVLQGEARGDADDAGLGVELDGLDHVGPALEVLLELLPVALGHAHLAEVELDDLGGLVLRCFRHMIHILVLAVIVQNRTIALYRA